MSSSRQAIGFAPLAALLFGLSTPAAKALLAEVDPWVTAGLLYLGSGIGLGGARLVQRMLGRRSREAPLRRGDLPWLAAAIVSGGGWSTTTCTGMTSITNTPTSPGIRMGSRIHTGTSTWGFAMRTSTIQICTTDTGIEVL